MSEIIMAETHHHAGSEVEVLKAQMLHMELKLAQLQEQNQILYAQQVRQNETMTALIQLLSQLGVGTQDIPEPVVAQHMQFISDPVVIETDSSDSMGSMMNLRSPDAMDRELLVRSGMMMTEADITSILGEGGLFA